jgi:hypothetical protein
MSVNPSQIRAQSLLRVVTTSTKREARNSTRKPSRTSIGSMVLQFRWGKRWAQAVRPRMRITTIAVVAVVALVAAVVVAADLAAAVARVKYPASKQQSGPENLSGPFCVG